MKNFFNRNKQNSDNDYQDLKYMNEVRIDLHEYSDVVKQIQMIHLSKQDLCIIRSMQDTIKEYLPRLVADFYKNLGIEATLMEIISKHTTVERLQQTLHQHLSEMFTGVIDDHFVKQRYTIAHAHVRIGLDPKWYMSAFQDLLQSLLNIIMPTSSSIAEYHEKVLAVTKIINLEQQIVLEAYELENKRIREQTIKEREKFVAQVSMNAKELAAVSEETSATSLQIVSRVSAIHKITETGSKIAISTEEKSKEGLLSFKIA